MPRRSTIFRPAGAITTGICKRRVALTFTKPVARFDRSATGFLLIFRRFEGARVPHDPSDIRGEPAILLRRVDYAAHDFTSRRAAISYGLARFGTLCAENGVSLPRPCASASSGPSKRTPIGWRLARR